MVEIHLNHLAIIVSAIAYFMLGALWFSPALFGNRWIELSGIKDKMETLRKRVALPYIVTFIAEYITCYALACVMSAFHAETAVNGMITALLTGVGFIATTEAVGHVFEGRPLKLWFINHAYHVVGLVIAGAVLGAWH